MEPADPELSAKYAPRAPLVGWPRQVSFTGGNAWLTPNGPAIVTQTWAPRATLSTVHGLCNFLDKLVAARVPARMPRLLVLHDWRSLHEVEPGARAVWTQRTRRADNPFGECDIYVALAGSPMLRMALRTAALTIQLAMGQRAARFVESIEPPMHERGVTPPSTGFLEWFLTRSHALPQLE